MNTDLTVSSYLYFKGINAGRCQLKCSKPVFISGQIKSIIVEDLFAQLPNDAVCSLTFQGYNSRIIEAKYLILDPAVEYAGLFSGDTLLASGPEFVSTGDSKRFSRIYEGCIGLKVAPKTIINNGNISYKALFASCTQLNDISQVKVNITNANYPQMFMEMFNKCTSLTTPLNISSITTISQPNVFIGMYMGCTLLTRLPDLSNITTVPDGTFNNMFEACQGIRIYNTQRDSTIPFKLNFS
jgi:hypothetical protein